MTPRRSDRRIERTRKQLREALIELMIKKGYEGTTVQDIIDRANVGRATFYAHFADKHALLESGLENLRLLLTSGETTPPQPLGFSLPMLEHAHGHLPLYRSLVGRHSGGFVIRRIQEIIAELVLRDFKAQGSSGGSDQTALAARFVSGAFMSVLTWWLEGGAKLTPREVDEIFRRLVTRGVYGEPGTKLPPLGPRAARSG